MTLFLAVFPVLLLIVLMAVFKVSGDKSGVCALIATAVIALFGFHMEAQDLGVSFLYGSLKAISPILLIIVMALFSYNVLLKTQKIEIIKDQFSAISTDKGIQVLLLTWGFGGLLEGMAGFGTAVAIPAAILISLGFKPIFSSLVSLIANSVATGFGAIGIPVITLAEYAKVEDVQTLSAHVVLQLGLLMFIIPFILLFLTDSSMKKLPRNIFLSLLVGAVSLGGQWAAAQFIGPTTPAIIGSLLSIIVIVIYARLTEKHADIPKEKQHSVGELFNAWSVYLLILLFVILTSALVAPVKNFLASISTTVWNFHVHGEVLPYKTAWLTHPGLVLFLGAFLGGLIQGAKAGELLSLLGKTFVQLTKTFVTVISLVALSTIMDKAGMITEIGVALAAATGAFYPLFAPFIGALGTFITGSDTSSNILFGGLQSQVATEIGANKSWLAAANTAGATGGKIISPQSIAIATSASNQQGEEGNILKSAIPYALGYVIIAGIMVYLGIQFGWVS